MHKTNLKIAVFHEIPYGGGRRAVLEFGKKLCNKYEVDLYYVDDKFEAKADRIFSKSNFIEFKPRSWKGKDWRSKLYIDTIELYKLYLLHKKIAKKIDENHYDFVFVHASRYTETPFLLRFLKTKSVYYCQEPLRMVYEDLFENWNKLGIERKIYENINMYNRKLIDRTNVKKANRVLTTSIYIKNYIKKAYDLNVDISYMGIDEKVFYPVKIKKKFDLLFIGSKEKLDGYDLLMDTLKLMKNKPNCRILLYEDEWIDSDKKLRELYCQSKVLICLAKNEPFGLMPLEAAACGVTTVAVNEGGHKETIINGKTGILVERDAKDLAETLMDLLKNEKKIKELSKNALANVIKNWTWEINTNRLINHILSK